MSIPRPYSSLSPAGIRRLFLYTLVPALVAVFFMRSLGAQLVTDLAPLGIVSYELAPDIPASLAILDSWDISARTYAGLSLGFDFLFLLLYSVSISSGCVLIADRLEIRSSFFGTIGRIVAWAVLLAGVLDIIENIALYRLLTGAENPALPVIARWSAIPKFVFVAMGIVYLIAGSLLQVIRKPAPVFLVLLTLVGCTVPRNPDPHVEPGERAASFVITFGSCVDQAFDAPILDLIAAESPDVFILTGDNIYSDTEDPSVMEANYVIQAANPALVSLWNTSMVIGTWDDHDYGASDGGSEYPMRREAQRLFADFFHLADESPIRDRDGVYDTHYFESEGKRIQVILLDTRFFRGPLLRRDPARTYEFPGRYVPSDDTTSTMLGEAQWSWLEQQFREPADVRILVSSVQFVPDDHGWEKWGNLPHERDRLLRLIADTRAEGVLILSGDRHLSEISLLDEADVGYPGYPLFDVTSSALNKPGGGSDDEPNDHRFSSRNYRGHNYGRLSFRFDDDEPGVDIDIVDSTGTAVLTHSIRISDLKF